MKYNLFSLRLTYLSTIIVSGLFLISSCKKGTQVLVADFSKDDIGKGPDPTATVGGIWYTPGEVTVVTIPNAGDPGNKIKWARIPHLLSASPETSLVGSLSRSYTSGKYGILATLYIPYKHQNNTVPDSTYRQVAVQLLSVSSVGFLNLEFMPEGNVRIAGNDDTRFGHFEHNKSFVVNMELTVTTTAMTLDISLAGGGATGRKVITIPESSRIAVEQFSLIKFGVSFENKALLLVSGVTVTHFDQ